MRVIIIGGIAAGMSAAAKLKRENPECELIIYEKNEYISFGACGLPYYVGGFFDNHERMIARTVEQAKAMGICLNLKHEVFQVDANKQTVTVRNLETQQVTEDSYDRLMIATGAAPVMPPIKNHNLLNVYHLHSLEDGHELKAKLRDPSIRKVAIIGAGFIGLEVVEAAKHMEKQVSVFQIGSHVLDNVFDPEITELMAEELRKEGIDLHLDANVTAFEGNDEVTHVMTVDGNQYEADLVVVATGVRPNTAFLADTGIEMLQNGAIVIDSEGRTSLPNVYAAGDCATVPHLLKGNAYIPLATTANKLGRIIGSNLNGGRESLEGTLGSSCIKVLGLEAARTGLTEKEAIESGRKVKTKFITDKNHTDYYPGQEKLSIKLIYDADTLEILGGQTIGKDGAVLRCNVIAMAIYAKMTTKQLGMMDFCYAPPFARTWDVLNIAGNASK